jgi:hypothetical protein
MNASGGVAKSIAARRPAPKGAFLDELFGTAQAMP